MTIEPFARSHAFPPGPLTQSASLDANVPDPVMPGQPLRRCACGKVYRVRMRIIDALPFVVPRSADAERCERCQTRASA